MTSTTSSLPNILGVVSFTAMFWLTARRGSTAPICGMKVDRSKAIKAGSAEHPVYLCSAGYLERFEAQRLGPVAEREISGSR